MLILTRKIGEAIILDDDIEITLMDIQGDAGVANLDVGMPHRYCQLNLNYSDFIENSVSSKLRINTLQVYF